MFVDETWVTTAMTRARGRAPRGQRLAASVPHGHWKTSTFLAALRQDAITAPCVVDGAINRECFRAYVEQVLPPTLTPGDIVVMDNLSCHKIAGVEQTVTVCGAQLLFLPPYGPDLNPIEPAFAKVKALLRKAVERAVEVLWNRTACILDAFTPDDCRNFFRHAGYA